ncbi:hypothetical protein [Croceibacterium mercuriale]|uniref:hypothetical protein n=1 Tax=Croceibacterium mercuriale TaxID=1572751 RepID=UPI001269BA68|nr:hypothetical protein [Croceibacterium mercuriale]
MISDKLRAVKQQEQLATVTKVTKAMRLIEKEILRKGYYPRNKGQVTMVELASRAGIGRSTLKNPGHKELQVVVKAWVKRMRVKSAVVRKPAGTRPSASQLRPSETLAFQQLNTFKVHYEELLRRVSVLELENAALRKKVLTAFPHQVI